MSAGVVRWTCTSASGRTPSTGESMIRRSLEATGLIPVMCREKEADDDDR
jgi:hypothetical protein